MSDDKQLLLEENNVSKSEHNYEVSNWRTKWLRPEIFLINFSIVAIFQGAIFTYLIGSLSTLEKRFAFESKISGYILIADNVSQIIVSPLVGYLGNRYNRPRIMAIGEIISAFSCFIFASPYFLYGPALQLLSDSSHSNSTYQLCKEDNIVDECNSSTVWTAVIIFLTANFLNGIGCTAFYTIGIPYIDDNTSKKSSPIYLSASYALRLFGPSLGLLLSSKLLNFYENPTMVPNIGQIDPRWIGCWWLGFILIGIFQIIFSIPLAFFPKQMLNKQNNSTKQTTNNLNIKNKVFNVWNAVKRLYTNPIFVFHVLGIAFKLIGYLGYYIFKPKYIESQFGKSASDANFWTGIIIIPTMAFGIISSGVFMSKIKPKTQNVALYVFVIELIISFTILYAKTLQCPTHLFSQTHLLNENFDLSNSCNINCHCTTKVFQPVCSNNQKFNYFSPCHAGCTQQTISDINANKKTFLNCKCDHFGGEVSSGYCPTDCNQFTSYILLFSIIGIVSSTGKIGDTLITLRCVDSQDKNFAIGITGAFLAIFAFIPYPIIFGAITDSACYIWKKSCGESGNCWIYDIEKLTKYLHNSAFGFMIVGTVMHLLVVLYANRITNMFEEEDNLVDSTALVLLENESHSYTEDKVLSFKEQ